MSNNKNNEVTKFYQYLEENNMDKIIQELPLLLKSFGKINTRFDRIIKQSDKQQIDMLKLKDKIEENHNQISNLLNNAGQGFLYFDRDMKIGSQYSKEVSKIFNKEVENLNITELLYTDDENDAKFLEITLNDILDADGFRQEVLISLLKKEFFICDRYIDIEYKILDKNSFMLILTDITSQKELTQKIKDEQQVLKMVVETVTLFDQFISVKDDYEEFISKIEDFKTLPQLSNLRKEIHTYKGLFAQKEMVTIVKKLHDFESLIDTSLKNNIIDDKILEITQDIMDSWLIEDMSILINILGTDYFKQSATISTSKHKIENLHQRVLDYLKSKNTKNLVELSKDLLKLQHTDITILFKPYEKLVEQLSLKLEKYIHPLIIISDNIYVPDTYKSFINSLVHIFRNSVDHGIETLDERYENDKDEYGTIKCTITQNQTNIYITISDDGAGIDEEKIKALAVKKNIYSISDIETLTHQEILLIIFNDAFSTNDIVTDISGRGVGLASVLDELNKLNGQLEIINNFKKGVSFTFILPKG